MQQSENRVPVNTFFCWTCILLFVLIKIFYDLHFNKIKFHLKLHVSFNSVPTYIYSETLSDSVLTQIDLRGKKCKCLFAVDIVSGFGVCIFVWAKHFIIIIILCDESLLIEFKHFFLPCNLKKEKTKSRNVKHSTRRSLRINRTQLKTVH